MPKNQMMLGTASGRKRRGKAISDPGPLPKYTGRFGEQQAELGEKQAKLGEEQAKRAEEASRQLQKLIDEAFKNGLVQPEPR